ncbi:MAG TPA: hypothetical protein VJU59_26445 [Paraburkholderia sp.]|nr:hypothetical protein [Paraburkholderia sp.]
MGSSEEAALLPVRHRIPAYRSEYRRDVLIRCTSPLEMPLDDENCCYASTSAVSGQFARFGTVLAFSS